MADSLLLDSLRVLKVVLMGFSVNFFPPAWPAELLDGPSSDVVVTESDSSLDLSRERKLDVVFKLARDLLDFTCLTNRLPTVPCVEGRGMGVGGSTVGARCLKGVSNFIGEPYTGAELDETPDGAGC